MKKSLCLIVLLVVAIFGVKFGSEWFQSTASSKDAIRGNAAYVQLAKALQNSFDSDGVLPKDLSELKFDSPRPDISNFSYTRIDDSRCIVSFHGKNGSSFVHPLAFEASISKTNRDK
jgi:hypothetical protein